MNLLKGMEQMGKKLVLAEKPSVARDIAKVLKCSSRKDGYIEGANYVITWAVGHLITLAEPDDYDEKYKKWRYNELPIIPNNIQLKPYPNTEKQLRIIDGLAKREDIESIICATDSGREGELIFRYIYDYIGCKKPFSRLWISSMTDVAITEGFNKLKDGKEYDNLFYSAKCRSEADWLVGINATRAYTTSNNVLLSIGRVQTPTLALIVNRHNEINNFKPKDYFEVYAVFVDDFKAIWFNEKPSDTKIFDQKKADEIAQKIKNKEGTVEEVNKKLKKMPPPLLYDLTELQRDGNKKFGYTAKRVLTIAQDLYEKRKLLTYPRTDSRYLSDDMKNKVKSTMNKINIPPYNKAIKPLLDKGNLKFNKRIINNSKVTDHHAIIPTDVVPNLTTLTKDELNIYNLVVKRFIAVFYDYYKYETTEIIFDIEGEKFVSSGKVIVDKGWKALYTATKDDKEQIMPKLKKGDTREVIDVEKLTKKTTPPKPYTESSLLGAMENAGRFTEDEALKEQLKESGFGTPATRAGIIERLIQVEYIKRKGKTLIPTKKGCQLIKIIPEELKSPETTGKWEKGLTSINKGNMESNRFMDSIKRFVVYLVNSASKSKGKVKFETKPIPESKKKKVKGLGTCPICKKGQILENTKSFYCSEWRNNCKYSIWKNSLERYGKKAIEKDTITKLLKDKKISDFNVTLPQTGEKCVATLEINANTGVELKNIKRLEVKK
ncbi:MAG: DNA topoisomerase III [Vallitalea sp.]|jgi:DNA topoisomerase-3|nr:DNA topoisomerase III [Vallitalea sp.]